MLIQKKNHLKGISKHKYQAFKLQCRYKIDRMQVKCQWSNGIMLLEYQNDIDIVGVMLIRYRDDVDRVSL